ncbi:uncharacterized protein F4812DRAFT_114866 [Daldinia caldariorum]|uniref:uncharacterized protein n=1 Tax=Daldinia caldariorum TaxID=326644 RepID=UPI0020089157|nr:uncharacterized protein F4812DRAFT_114866 [Daldinia caldariorum]KAI1465856.1 hypothetical protein F4812DRAFT_114866 [Daldinia caldariorum]
MSDENATPLPNEEAEKKSLDAFCIAAIALAVIVLFFICIPWLIPRIRDCHIQRKRAKEEIKRSCAERLRSDLEANAQAYREDRERPAQRRPRPVGGDFSGFEFSNSPYAGAGVPPAPDTPAVPAPAATPAASESAYPAGHVRDSVDGPARGTSEQRDTDAEAAPRTATEGVRWSFHNGRDENGFELEEIDIHKD